MTFQSMKTKESRKYINQSVAVYFKNSKIKWVLLLVAELEKIPKFLVILFATSIIQGGYYCRFMYKNT